MDANNSAQLSYLYRKSAWHYEHAYFELAIASFLICQRPNACQLRRFISAAIALSDAYSQDRSPESALDVLLWTRRRLNQEAKKAHEDELYRAGCLREVQKVEMALEKACVTLSKGRLTILD